MVLAAGPADAQTLATSCPERRALTEQERATLIEHLRQATELTAAGRYDQALEELYAAYLLEPSSGAEAELLRVATRSPRVTRALEIVKSLNACIERSDEVVREIDARLARLRIIGPASSAVRIDDRAAGVLPLSEVLRLDPGRVRVQVHTPDGRIDERALELLPGSETTIVVESVADSHPPEPHTQPRFPDPSSRSSEPLIRCPNTDLRAGPGLAVLYSLLLSPKRDDRARLGHALRPEVFYSLPCGEHFELRVGALLHAALAPRQPMLGTGASLEVALYFGPLRIGVGGAGGWQLAAEEELDPGERAALTGPFVQPAITAAAHITDHLETGGHVSLMFSNQRLDDDDAFRFGAAGIGLWAAWTFAPRCISDQGEREPCR